MTGGESYIVIPSRAPISLDTTSLICAGVKFVDRPALGSRENLESFERNRVEWLILALERVEQLAASISRPSEGWSAEPIRWSLLRSISVGRRKRDWARNPVNYIGDANGQ